LVKDMIGFSLLLLSLNYADAVWRVSVLSDSPVPYRANPPSGFANGVPH
jgi:hypothetical protein